MSKIRASLLNGFLVSRNPGETDQELRNRIQKTMPYFTEFTWLDGQTYQTKPEKALFGRVSHLFRGWGEMRKQKKPPHTEVLYVWTLQAQELVLRSINNIDNNQLREAIQLAGLRLEQHMINQTEAEFILDRCYAELQRRMEWTERKRHGKKSKGVEGGSILEGPT